MDHDTLLGFLGLAEKLKCRTRHSWTSSGRHESVAEHVYRLMVFAWLVRDEFPDVDMNRVMELALFHDMGEAITGDIPAFEKTGEDERAEEQALEQIADLLPGPRGEKLREIFREITTANRAPSTTITIIRVVTCTNSVSLMESTGVMTLSSSTMRLSPEGVRVMVT